MTEIAFAILGAGRMGRALGKLLVSRGHRPGGLTCRRLRSARQAVAFIEGGAPMTDNAAAAAGASLVIIGTPDGAIAPLARGLARSRVSWERKVVAHISGALSSAALEPLARLGARTASWHPLTSVADPRTAASSFEKVPFAIEGDPKAVRPLRRLVASWGGLPITIPRHAKALYHLIACLLSNDLVALLSFGLEAAHGVGLSRREAARLYLPLVRGTVENVARMGPVKALTGPVSRGDITTLRLHAEPLRALPADFRKLHRLLALHTAELARKAKTISPETAARLARMLLSLP